MHDIVAAVRRAVPSEIAVTSKMRLGYDSPDGALDCARALADGGSAHVVVHARTKVDGYRPPAHWEWVARVAEAVRVPVFANGECGRSTTTCVVARSAGGGHHARSRPGLASWPGSADRRLARWRRNPRDALERAVAAAARLLATGPAQARPALCPGRLKQWLGMLTRTYPEAVELFARIRRESDCETIDRLLQVSFSQAA